MIFIVSITYLGLSSPDINLLRKLIVNNSPNDTNRNEINRI